MENRIVRKDKDLVIVGGGIPGIVTAIQAARLGLTVALINNRGYMGGNASAEIDVNISGATGVQEFNYFARETGIMEELIIENMHKNVMGNRYVWDAVLTDKLLKEKNIELFANTNIDKVETEDDRIVYVSGSQLATDTRFEFFAPLFVDDTGDGTVGYLSGAEFRYGREGKDEFNERVAPDKPDNHVLPSTLNFVAKDMGKPVPYTRPDFALNLFERSDILKYRVIPKNGFTYSQWFYEIDGDKDQMKDAEEIIMHHKSLVYGIWDYIKNSGEYDSENYDLQYVSPVPGKRESRRLVGDYMLTETDVFEQSDFDDVVGHGGWSIDLHAIRGFYATEPINKHIMLDGIFQIPYRCGYSKNISNLFAEGRCMSTTHVAFGATRVMATLATLGQANAVAAYLCKKYNTTPRGVYENHLHELQTELLKEDQYIIGKPYKDEKNLAQKAAVSVSSVRDLASKRQDGADVLDRDISISLPVLKTFKGVKVLLKVLADTELSYYAALPDKGENFNPETVVSENKLQLEKTADFEWITLPCDLTLEKAANVFFVLCANENIKIAFSNAPLTGVMCSVHDENHGVTIVDRHTLGPKEDVWHRWHKMACFEAVEKEPVFAGENLTNGFTRPYRGANIWQAKGVKDEYFTLELPEKKQLSEMVLVMDTDLDKYYATFDENKHANVPSVIKDFDVYYKNEAGEFELLTSVREHYQRLASINLNHICTNVLKVVVKDTWGQDFAALYDVRVYE